MESYIQKLAFQLKKVVAELNVSILDKFSMSSKCLLKPDRIRRSSCMVVIDCGDLNPSDQTDDTQLNMLSQNDL